MALKHRHSSIVAVFDVTKLQVSSLPSLVSGWASAAQPLVQDAVIGQIDGGQVVMASPGQQIRLVIGAGRLEATDFGDATSQTSLVPFIVKSLADFAATVTVKALGFNHDFDVAVGDTTPGVQIAGLFLDNKINQVVTKQGGVGFGGAVRLFFVIGSGKWNLHVTPDEQNKTIRISLNLERTDVPMEEKALRAAWKESREALLELVNQFQLVPREAGADHPIGKPRKIKR